MKIIIIKMNHTIIGLCGNAGRQGNGGMRATPIQGPKHIPALEGIGTSPTNKPNNIYFFTSPPYTPPTMKFI